MPRLLSIPLALALVVAACTQSGESTTTSDNGTVTSSSAGASTTSTEVSPSTTARETTPITEADLSGLTGVSEEVRAQLVELVRTAQELRGLAFIEPPNITVVSDEELEARVRADIEENAEDFPADEALYKLLGLLAETADFRQIVLDLYGEQAGGFYDGEAAEIVVPARDEGFSVLQQGTLVHEMVHALTDQHFGVYDEFRAMVDEDRLDEATAYQALIEGDATLAEALWVQTLPQSDLGEFLAESLTIDSTALDAAPRFLRESLFFPYDTGLSFVQTLYLSGDWEAVNDAYTTMADLPGSSEQVITPDDYTRDLPLSVDIPPVEIPGYELERTSVWGELGLRIMLNQGSGVESLIAAVDGWGGDSYHQWYDGENAAMLLVYEGDTQQDVAELEDALVTFSTESVPEDAFSLVDTSGGKLYFIAADDETVGEQIRTAVGLP